MTRTVTTSALTRMRTRMAQRTHRSTSYVHDPMTGFIADLNGEIAGKHSIAAIAAVIEVFIASHMY